MLGQVSQRLQVAHAGQAVQECQAVEQQARREDAQEEVLGGRLLRAGGAPGQVEQQVRRHAHQFQPDEQEDQLVGRGDEHRAGVDHQQRAEELGRPGGVHLVVRQRQQDQARQHQDESRVDRRRRRSGRPPSRGRSPDGGAPAGPPAPRAAPLPRVSTRRDGAGGRRARPSSSPSPRSGSGAPAAGSAASAGRRQRHWERSSMTTLPEESNRGKAIREPGSSRSGTGSHRRRWAQARPRSGRRTAPR